MKKISLEELLKKRNDCDYAEQVSYILELTESGKIKPVKASPVNGKKPALHTFYWCIEPEKTYPGLKEELLYQTHPKINVSYYLNHLECYEEERRDVRCLHYFLMSHSDALTIPVSYHERSFEIWGREKFLTNGNGRTLLRHCGFNLADLNCYNTEEPFAFYSSGRYTPQNILILENKDPFYGMRQHLLNGGQTILGIKIDTLIYGGGKRILSAFRSFELSAEPYIQHPENRFYYFGDLDYEGIIIYEKLSEMMASRMEIKPFVPAYGYMLKKAAMLKELPKSSDRQNKNIQKVFYGFFPEEVQRKIQVILNSGRYIPQEILTIRDYEVNPCSMIF